jgi:hypothetical protein
MLMSIPKSLDRSCMRRPTGRVAVLAGLSDPAKGAVKLGTVSPVASVGATPNTASRRTRHPLPLPEDGANDKDNPINQVADPKRIIRVFARRTSYTPNDDLSFVGDPQLWRPDADEVHVSITFSWDIQEGYRLQSAWAQYYPVVKIGGPAFGNSQGTFLPGMYVKRGVTFTTRGCNNSCPWCFVPGKEGKLVEIADFADGWTVQDNNLLQASRPHIARVIEMLKHQDHAAVFAGGIQSSLVDQWFVDQLRSIRVDSLFLAADTVGSLSPLEKALKQLSVFGRRKLRVYCMIGRSETVDQAKERLEAIWQMGGLPFAQLYQPSQEIDYGPEWRNLRREWSRPAAMFANHAKGSATSRGVAGR